jgi:hypothetical protein
MHPSTAAPVRRGRWRFVDRLEATPPRRFAWAALGVYVIASLFVYYPLWPGTTHLTVGLCPCGDVVQEMWFLKWTPWAILHGHNPLFTNWMGWPDGANLAANTAMPLLAVLVAPVTLLWGPVASYNLVMWAAFPLSAFACYYVVGKVTRSNLAALVAGAVYGFSPYMASQGFGHAFLIFVPLPPLIFYVLYRVAVAPSGRAWREGLTLGLLAIAQFLISEEVAALTGIVAVVALAIVGVARGRHLDRTRWRYLGEVGLVAAATTVVVLAYPLYFQFLGPQAVRGAAHATVNSAFKLDLLGTVVPDHLQVIHPGALTRLGDAFTGSDLAENGGYLGAPLVFALALVVWTMRRRRLVVLTGAVLVVVEVLSMGRWFTVANHTIHVDMPWSVVSNLPLFKTILSSRFAVMASFFVAALVGMGVAQWIQWARRAPRPRRRDRRRPVNVALAGLALASAVVYLPRFPLATTVMPSVPSFFTSADDRQIPAGSVVLPFPFSASPFARSMYWQIRSDFRWRMLGGEIITPTRHGRITGQPVDIRPLAAAQYLMHMTGSNTVLPVTNQKLIDRMRELLFLNDVGTVIVDPTAVNAAPVEAIFTDVMGPPQREGGVDVWFHAQALASRRAAARGA